MNRKGRKGRDGSKKKNGPRPEFRRTVVAGNRKKLS